MKRQLFKCKLLLLMPVALMSLANAQPTQIGGIYPEKTVHLIVPFSAGGALDAVARTLGQQIQQLTNQNVVVENKPGATGLIAIQTVLGAGDKGHSLLVAPSGVVVIAPQIRPSPVDPLKSLIPICQFAEGAPYVFVGPHVKASSMKELAELARNNPGRLTYASGGVGTQLHLTGELISQQFGAKMIHVPYKGANDSVADLIAGRVDLMFDPTIVRIAKEGRVRAIGYMGSERSAELPDVPTLKELGFAQLPIARFGLFADIRTPKTSIDKIALLCKQATETKELGDKMKTFSYTPRYFSVREFTQLTKQDHSLFGELIRKAAIKGDQ